MFFVIFIFILSFFFFVFIISRFIKTCLRLIFISYFICFILSYFIWYYIHIINCVIENWYLLRTTILFYLCLLYFIVHETYYDHLCFIENWNLLRITCITGPETCISHYNLQMELQTPKYSLSADRTECSKTPRIAFLSMSINNWIPLHTCHI